MDSKITGKRRLLRVRTHMKQMNRTKSEPGFGFLALENPQIDPKSIKIGPWRAEI